MARVSLKRRIYRRIKSLRMTGLMLMLLGIAYFQYTNMDFCNGQPRQPSPDVEDHDTAAELQGDGEDEMEPRVELPKLRFQLHQNGTKAPRLKSRPKTDSNWIVIYADDDKCDVTHFLKSPGWSVVVVGEKPAGCRSDKCTHVTSNIMKNLNYDVSAPFSISSPRTKMVGYLYAISKGATAIYDTHCAIVPRFDKNGFVFGPKTNGLIYSSKEYNFNPYGHFGHPLLSPVGFSYINSNKKRLRRYRIADIRTPAIQQGQTNFVLRKNDVPYLKLTKNLNITFDRSSPPVFLSGLAFAPINSYNTLYRYEAFWALFIPRTMFSDAEVTRGYIAQRLLIEIDSTVGFLPPTAYYTKSNAGSKRFVVDEERPDNANIRLLMKRLRDWTCNHSLSFFQCAKSLISYLNSVDGSEMHYDDTKTFGFWISDLEAVGYPEPKRQPRVDIAQTLWNPYVLYSSPKVLPSELIFTGRSKMELSKYFLKQPNNMTCPNQEISLSQWFNPPITDIMLLVIFNYKFLCKNMKYIEYTQRMYFRHILYCGPCIDEFEDLQEEINMHYHIYIDGVDKEEWFYIYQCLIHAASMNLNVKGYFYMGDDVLLNTWNIIDFPRDMFWMQRTYTIVNRTADTHPWKFYYWNKPLGKKAANAALDEIQGISRRNPGDKMVSNFLSMYDQNIGLSNLVHRSIDVFYAPAKYNEEIVRFGRIFRKHNTLLALAISMLHSGLVEKKNVVHLQGKSLWKSERTAYTKAYDKDNHYVHPFKSKGDLATKAGRQFFCDTYYFTSRLKLAEIKSRKKKNRTRK